MPSESEAKRPPMSVCRGTGGTRSATRIRRGVAAASVLMATLALPLRTSAQNGAEANGSDPWAGVEEMLVTGTSSAGLLADTTTSAIAFDAGELEDIGAQDVSDLARFTPSLEINTTSATTPTFFIRGVGLNDANANAAGAISIYVDDVPINSAAIQLAGLFDTAAVEVLRGPQAYIDARNASGGMINTVSNKPDGEFSSRLRFDYGSFGYNDTEGYVGFPIFDGDILSGRIAFRRTWRDDLIENRCGNVRIVDDNNPPISCNERLVLSSGAIPMGLDSETNDLNRWGARGLILFRPDVSFGDMEWLFNVHTARIDQTSPLGQTFGTGANSRGQPASQIRYSDPDVNSIYQKNLEDLFGQGIDPSQVARVARAATLETVTRNIERARPFRNDYDFVGPEILTQIGGSVNGEIEIGNTSIKTVTGIERWDRERDRDFDFGSGESIIILSEDDATQYTQNIGLEHELEAMPIRLGGGGYVLVEQLDSVADFTLRVGGGNSLVNQFIQNYTQDLYSFGVFANFEWDILEDLTLEAGARVNWERKEFELILQKIEFGDILPPSAPSEVIRTWSAPTWGFSLNYSLTEDILAYWKYTRGWKAGHINASVLEIEGTPDGTREDTIAATPTVAQPETIDSVEFGINAAFVDSTIKLGAAAFYYKYDNYQVFLIESQAGSPPQLEIINANTAQVYGVEADLELRPLEMMQAPEWISALTLKMNFSWLESEFLDFSDRRTAFGRAPVGSTELRLQGYTVDFTGNRLPNTPEFKLSASGEWTFVLGNLGSLTTRYDITWTDDIFFDPSQGRGTPRFGELSTVFPEYTVGQRAYTLHDVRVTYSDPTDTISVAGWGRNLTNTIYKRNVLDLTTVFRQVNNFVGDPRTYGFSVSIKF